MGAIAMTEPATGSDLAGMRTSARKDGGDWVLNGQKTFITGGINADLVIVAARTSTHEERRKGALPVRGRVALRRIQPRSQPREDGSEGH